MAPSPHPPAERLIEFGRGQVSVADGDAIERHLDSCDTCRGYVETAADDDFVKRVRDVLPGTNGSVSTAAAYRHVRFHAKGGLGEVSVARDVALGRDVAVKRLLPRGAASESVRARFLREARVTGRLEHPGIVPVYGVGEDDAGRPCYAMRFVPGDTLADAIRALHANGPVPTAALRPLLARFVSLCGTVAYAHSKGVVHRDIKPNNVAIGPYGETILLDWGLAQVPDEPEPDLATPEDTPADAAARTQTGTILGTPGFLAPEQAAGGRVGPAADVFSLGVSLRCLLTGRWPHEPPGPTGAPIPLLAVAGLASAPNPDARYATALDLAADLDRWLADEAVTAYREPLPGRVRRFVRHHASATAATVSLLAVSVVGLGVGTVLVDRERGKTATALADKTNLAVAEAEQRTKAERAEAQMLADFRAGSDEAITRLVGAKPSLGPDERAYLESTLKRWLAFADRAGDDERGWALRAEGHFRVAQLWGRLGKLDESAREYGAARDAFRHVADLRPDVPKYRRNLAGAHTNLGTRLRDLGRFDEAKMEYRAAAEAQRALADTGANADRAQALRDLAATYMNLGNLHDSTGDRPAARVAYEAARDSLLGLSRDDPSDNAARTLLAGARHNLGTLFVDIGQPADARPELEAARDLRVSFLAAAPSSPDLRHELAQSRMALGVLNRALARPDEARDELLETRTLLDGLVASFPSVPAYRLDLAYGLRGLATVHREARRFAPAREALDGALKQLATLAKDVPDVAAVAFERAQGHYDLGLLSRDAGDRDAARVAVATAVASLEHLVAKHPEIVGHHAALALAQTLTGRILLDEGRPGDALKWFDLAIALSDSTLAKTPSDTALQDARRDAVAGRETCLRTPSKPLKK